MVAQPVEGPVPAISRVETRRDQSSGATPETPSGKGAGDENFPVGSVLLPARLRPCVMAFYDFARAADDIADNPALDPGDKLARLDAMEAALDRPENRDKGGRLAAELARHGLDTLHARALLVAFRQDAVKSRYASLEELHFYCRNSADPVGRFLLDLHDGPHGVRAYPASDGLCTALQILNHLQDCGKDLAVMDRCYLPLDLLEAEGASVDDLRQSSLTPGLRRVLDRLLEDVDAQLARAARLPRALRSRRLAMESAVIIRLARRLARRLRRDDPLAMRVELGRWDFLAATVTGAIAGLIAGGRGAA